MRQADASAYVRNLPSYCMPPRWPGCCSSSAAVISAALIRVSRSVRESDALRCRLGCASVQCLSLAHIAWRRAHPPERFRDKTRPSPIMGGPAAGLTDEEIAVLATYLAGLKP